MKKLMLSLVIIFNVLIGHCFAEEVCPVGSVIRIVDAESVRFEYDNKEICHVSNNELFLIAPGRVNVKVYATFGKRVMFFHKELVVEG